MDVALPASALPGARPGLRVLVVEDEPLLQWAIAQSLKAVGHTVLAAGDAAAALQVAAAPDIALDVLLLDYRLPDSSDFSLLVRLRQLRPALPLVMMTACNSPELTAEARALGAFDVIDKPFDLRALDGCLRAAIAAGAGQNSSPRGKSPQPPSDQG